MAEESNPCESLFAEWMRRCEAGGVQGFEALMEAHPEHGSGLRELHSAWQMISRAMENSATPTGSGAVRVSSQSVTLGRYVKLELLGRGGQGEVWLAEDTRLRRRVALKLLRETDPARLRRFEREAGITSKLDHPGICPVYESGEESGTYFIAMRFVEGRSLAKLLVDSAETWSQQRRARKSLPSSTSIPTEQREIQRLVRILASTARALHAAHEAGVVHRDVKPGNILVTKEDEPVVVDFGFAQDSEGGWSEITRSAEFLGTPAYMSPEQIRGNRRGNLDRRTDIWSLGATVYECLAGARPFAGPTWQAAFHAIATEEPPRLSGLNPALDRDLEVIVETALEKERERRYSSADAFANDLEAWLEGRPITARAISAAGRLKRWARREPALALLLGVLALALPTLGALAAYVSLTREDVRAGEAMAFERKLEERLLDGYARLSQREYELALPAFEDVLHSNKGSVDAGFGKFWSLHHIEPARGSAYLRDEFPVTGGGVHRGLPSSLARGRARFSRRDLEARFAADAQGCGRALHRRLAVDRGLVRARGREAELS